ncbi:class I adenylate-forming enzyme family protein [Lyngbya confervoides]|uniref:AMP-binding protein n=1 Tax=Lyngbya confervoides BDU141951 TaxID=1574623 RepID=A0ABD4T583_9CYAN|nr:AMP-binding protein [Lyngbya confervoides]MCM1983663.1 AMP-binding protein [Lyngbya confervoides BDU141951]
MAMTLGNWLRQGATTYPHKIALIDTTQTWSYSELDVITDRLAKALMTFGLRPGDRVAFLLPNCPELVFLYFACFKLGAIAVPLNVRLKGGELAYILNHAQARLCISHADLFGELQIVQAELTQIEQFYLVGDVRCDGVAQPFSTLLQLTTEDSVLPEVRSDAIAAILYTSGTTARPKGVTHSHQTLTHTVRNHIAAIQLSPTDIVGGMLPMAHIFGFALQLLEPLSIGASLVLLPRFDPTLVLEAVQSQRVTCLLGLPVMFNALVNAPNASAYDVSSLRFCLGGGDAIPPVLNQQMHQQFGVEIYQGCGMTEVIPYTMNRPTCPNQVGSIGPASEGMSLRLVNQLGQEVAQGQVGEIWVQSQAIMLGYWHDDPATRQVLREGWLLTGDLAWQDEAGYYWFVGRSKEMIIRGGSNISPLEVESVLYEHPAVREAAVVGIPDPDWGERVAAFVALKAGETIHGEDLIAFIAERLAAYKVPERITYLADLPKGLTGKIHRKTLKDLAIASSIVPLTR